MVRINYISNESRGFFGDSNFTSKKNNPKDKLEVISIINHWKDISLENGLPKGSLFLKFDQKISS
ncbi:MAG: hypothetical protein CL780_01635 [Chloroflexi bacterium]|nr:hypothetical protein [Chloroflexota bacterium]